MKNPNHMIETLKAVCICCSPTCLKRMKTKTMQSAVYEQHTFESVHVCPEQD